MAVCPACAVKRLHTAEETAKYHPLAGHGYVENQGWSASEAEVAHQVEVEQCQTKR